MRRGKEKANKSKIMSESLAAEGNGGSVLLGTLRKNISCVPLRDKQARMLHAALFLWSGDGPGTPTPRHIPAAPGVG